MNKIPNFQDDVKNVANEFSGRVIAVYFDDVNPKQILFDIRINDDAVWYASPAENWETVRTEEERWSSE